MITCSERTPFRWGYYDWGVSKCENKGKYKQGGRYYCGKHHPLKLAYQMVAKNLGITVEKLKGAK